MKHPIVFPTPRFREAASRLVFAMMTLAVLSLVFVSAGCDMGTPQSMLRGVTQAAPKLDEYDNFGNYSPYFSTGEMKTPRYMHSGFLSRTGMVLVFGGSDERGLSSLDSVEIFDQSTFASDETPPESEAGMWIDTNFEGDPIVLQGGPRMLMSATELANNQVVLIGGSSNMLTAPVYSKVELFSPDTRSVSILENELSPGRFNHTTVQISTGDLLITGGQIEDTVAQTDDQGGILGGGQTGGQTGGLQTQTTVFPSTDEVKLFSPRDNTFNDLIPFGASEPTTLQTQRGRAGHAMSRIAGPDNRLNNSDDLYIILGGYQTLSGENAPEDKGFGAIGGGQADGLLTVEIFDPQTKLFSLITSVRLTGVRIIYPEAVNLGKYNDFTHDGVRGMGNAVLVTGGYEGGGDGGSVAQAAAGTAQSSLVDQVLIATYTPGAGPAQGIRFYDVVDTQYFTRTQNNEYQDTETAIARLATNTVTLPRPFVTSPGVDDVSSWVFSLAGVDPTGDYSSAGMLSGHVFDPFFSVRAAISFNVEPTDLSNERYSDPINFLGVVGTWLNIDGAVTSSMDDFSTTPPSQWPQRRAMRRVLHTCIQLAGVDGIPNTFDDRILLAGGGVDLEATGGDPSAPSAEVFLPPGSSTVE